MTERRAIDLTDAELHVLIVWSQRMSDGGVDDSMVSLCARACAELERRRNAR